MKHIAMKQFYIQLCIITGMVSARSIHRPVDTDYPYITTQWHRAKGPLYTLKSSHLGQYSLFHIFDKSFFFQHQLPTQAISFRYDPQKSVLGSILQDRIMFLLQEIKEKKKQYRYFTLLQKKDFNIRKGWGLLVLQFKEYPFVLKLFIETPESFVLPFDKGIEPIFCFFMGNGISRHLTGFTRLKNLEYINKKLAEHPRFSNQVTTPRKWYWTPRTADYITVTGYHIGSKKEQSIQIPGIYAVVADTIESEKKLSLFNKQDRDIALDICNYLHLSIDPHIKNFLYERVSHKIAIIDTEHFPSLVGLERNQIFGSYLAWYIGLSGKCFQNIYLRTKKERRKEQYLST